MVTNPPNFSNIFNLPGYVIQKIGIICSDDECVEPGEKSGPKTRREAPYNRRAIDA
jgi:hypothetical protein